VAVLYEHAGRYEKDARTLENGALASYSGTKTGRSPKDKRVVKHPNSEGEVWWGPVNMPVGPVAPTELESAAGYLTGAIVDAIHSGVLTGAKTQREPIFGLEMVTQCHGVLSEILQPRDTWSDPKAYDASASAHQLASFFVENFKRFETDVDKEVRAASPMC
jgi:ATP-dependent phosphoenolpyruvate carboxykinase